MSVSGVMSGHQNAGVCGVKQRGRPLGVFLSARLFIYGVSEVKEGASQPNGGSRVVLVPLLKFRTGPSPLCSGFPVNRSLTRSTFKEKNVTRHSLGRYHVVSPGSKDARRGGGDQTQRLKNYGRNFFHTRPVKTRAGDSPPVKKPAQRAQIRLAIHKTDFLV